MATLKVYDGTQFVSIGGTAVVSIGSNITSGTSGSVLYIDASGNLAQDNANFFWDATNHRLGIATTSPGAKLEVDASGTGTKNIISKNFASQTANNFEAQNSSGTAYFSIGPDTQPTNGLQSFINVVGTLATTTTATNGDVAAFDLNITSPSTSGSQNNMYVINGVLRAGYTGNNISAVAAFTNLVAGIGTNPFGGTAANYGFFGVTAGTTTGTNIAAFGDAQLGNVNYGGFFEAIVTKNSATNIGCAGFGLNAGSSPIQIGGYFALVSSTPTYTSAALVADNGSIAAPIFVARDNGTDEFVIGDGGLVTKYNAAVTTGYGIPSIYGSDRKTGLTAAQALATYTVGSSDGSFIVSANVLVTTATVHSFTVTVSYTDEGNTARVLTLNFSTIAGVLTPTIAAAGGAVPYEGVPLHIRAKASTTIIIATAAGGTYTTVVYNFEENITQIS